MQHTSIKIISRGCRDGKLVKMIATRHCKTEKKDVAWEGGYI